MTGRRISGWLLPLALFLAAFVGCNIFNPSGKGSEDDGDADGLIAVGEQCMRDKDFDGAYDAFSKALAQDSSKSLAWHGLAKAMVARDSLPITELIRRAKDLGGLKAGDSLPFLNEGDSVKNRFYRPLLRLQSIITAFRVRDSLGRTDGVYNASREGTDLLIASNLGLILKLGDLNRDTTFDTRDNLLKGAFDSLSSGGIKPNAIAADSFLSTGADGTPDTTGNVNTQKVADFNNFVQGMGNDVETNRTILKQVASTSKPSTDTSEEDVNTKIDKFLNQAGGSIIFWKLNDSLDNDGDGCIDEEVWGDKTDNDGDGITDEDARASYLFPGYDTIMSRPYANAPDDGILNDRFRIVGDSMRAVYGRDDADSGFFRWVSRADGRTKAFASLTWVDPTTDSVYTRVVAQNPSEKPADQLSRARNEIRLQILALPPARRIDEGARRVGGCWLKYKEGITR